MYEDKIIKRAFLVQTLRDYLAAMHEHEIGITSSDLDLASNEVTTLKTNEKLIVPAINELWEKSHLHATIAKTTYADWRDNHKNVDMFDVNEGNGPIVYVISDEFDAVDEHGDDVHFYPDSLIVGVPVDPTAEQCAFDWSYVVNPHTVLGDIADIRTGYTGGENFVDYFNMIEQWINNDGTSAIYLDGLETEHQQIVPAINELFGMLKRGLQYDKVATFGEWLANFKHQYILPTANDVPPMAVQIEEPFTFNDIEYPAGSWLMGEDTVVDPDTTGYLTYDWYAFEQPFYRLGLNKDLTTIAKDTIVNAINELDDKQGDEELTVVDTTDGKTAPEHTISASINVLDKEIGDMNTTTVVDTVAGETDAKKVVVEAVNVLDKDLGDVNTLTVLHKDHTTLSKEAVDAINTLDELQGDDDLTVVDTKNGKATPEETITAAINVIDDELGENTDIDANIDEKDTIVEAINSVYKQREVTITESIPEPTDPDYKTVLKTYKFYQDFEADNVTPKLIGKIDLAKDLVVTSGVVYTADGTETYPSTGEPCNLEAGKVYIKLTIANQDDPLYIDVRDLYNDYTVEEDATSVQLTITDERQISAIVVDKAISHAKLDDEVNAELAFLDYNKDDDPHLTTDAQTVRTAIDELNATKTVSVTEVANPGEGVSKAYDINQYNADGTVDQKGTIEIPYSNYEGEATDTVEVTVDSTDGHRVITADVVDGSIGRQQLDTDVNAELDYVGKDVAQTYPTAQATLTDYCNTLYADILQRVKYITTCTYNDFQSAAPTAKLDDLFVISNDFTYSGVEYKAGSWILKTGADSFAYINNGGGDASAIKPITSDDEIREGRDPDTGESIITDILGPNNITDKQGTIYMVSIKGNPPAWGPHHGIYMKTDDAGGTKVLEIFDFGKAADGSVYVGSNGTNITVTVTPTTDENVIGASIVLGSLNKTLMDTEINNIFAFTGYPTPLTTTGQTLAEGINEHDAELGDIINAALEIKDGTKNDVAEILKAIAKNNLTWEGSINATAATTIVVATEALKRGYVYNVTGVDSTINGIDCKDGDWLVVISDVTIGAQPSYLKLGSSSGGGADDGGPFKIFR